jgi:hypothetical protein
MYLRTTKANTKADGPVEYLQLCHNYYDKATKRSKTEVVYNFGRKDNLDIKTIEQLITNLAGFIAKETGVAPPSCLQMLRPLKPYSLILSLLAAPGC